jgi:hypothetical protein
MPDYGPAGGEPPPRERQKHSVSYGASAAGQCGSFLLVEASSRVLDVELKPWGACGKHSPSCTCSTFPVGEPKMFSSSKCPVMGACVPGWCSFRSAERSTPRRWWIGRAVRDPRRMPTIR